jgi:hypothetical protein
VLSIDGEHAVIKVCKQCQLGFWATAHAPQRYCDPCRREREGSVRLSADAQKKAKARRAVRYAVHMRRLTQEPCEVCGVDQTQAHHVDYDRPLDIRWLCPAHHAAEHRKGA